MIHCIGKIKFETRNMPELDPGFTPLSGFFRAFRQSMDKAGGMPLTIAVERENGQVGVFETWIHGTNDMRSEDEVFVERIVKTLLWAWGGWRVIVGGSDHMAAFIRDAYRAGGTREFDAFFMARIYEKPFTVEGRSLRGMPKPVSLPKSIGRHLEGCRIGFDAGGSDRKVSAVVDGEAVWSEEVVWHPKLNTDPDYHFGGIVEAFKSAAAKMPRVDAIGVSSAGVYVANRTMAASLFLKVNEQDFNAKVKDIYIRAAKEIDDVPLEVANDGDVTALAGAMELNDTNVLGIAMGTSQAGGFVDGEGNITGWLNELAFVPLDLNPGAMTDEWSGDTGCGVKYFSQDGVAKLAPAAGIALDGGATPAEKLKAVQKLMEKGDGSARAIYESIGCYLGHALAYYSEFYDMKHVLLMGRVMSGDGGNTILATAGHVLRDEYPELAEKLLLHLPDEASRRVGQSVAAASLPEINI
jgi:predicted NBD/HSP70 family sugar kinase